MSRINSPSEADHGAKGVKEKVEELHDCAHEKLSHLRETAGEYYNKGRERAREWEHGVEEYVRTKPLKSLLMAAGAGMLLGMIWRRR